MAKQHQRKQPKGKAPASKPITSHPLFPAVVALWFGALFGLGSLAVRPSLIEGLVMKSHLDLVVPAAAPPLGITARILIALVLAALGAVIGLLIVRRITRPKAEVRQRKRGKFSGEATDGGYTNHPAYVAPESGESAFGAASETGGLLAGRRRGALAIEPEEVDFVPHEMAPLPGGAPQVLDITGVELTGYAPIGHEDHESAPLDLGAFAQPAPAMPEPVSAAPAFAPPSDAEMVGRQLFQPAPPIEAPAFAAPSPATAPFAMPQASFEAPQASFEAPQPVAAPFAPPVAEPVFAAPASPIPQAFDPAAPAPAAAPEPAGRQIFGMPIDGDHVDQNFMQAAGFKTTVFEQDEPEPLFPARQTTPEAPREAAEPVFTVPVVPAFAPVAAEPAPVFEPTPVAVATPEPLAAAPAAPALVAEPLPPVGGLGMTDLASRLQQSMQRRRAARAGVELPVEQPVAEPVVPVAEPAPIAEPAAPFAIPQAFAAPDAAPEPVVEAQAPTPAFAPPPAEPVASLLSPAPSHAAPDPAVVVPPAPMAMPRALRPLSFDDAEDDADDMLASLLPPRNIAMPVPAQAPAPAPVVVPEPVAAAPVAAAPFAAPFAASFAAPQPAEEPVPVEAEVGEEESYASLLDIGQPLSARSQFVRIEEPEAEDAPVEPVVIFPGQAPLAAVPSPAEAVPFRRFDAPSAAGQGGPVASATGLPATDPAEADQALRAALANLQRMSGAA